MFGPWACGLLAAVSFAVSGCGTSDTQAADAGTRTGGDAVARVIRILPLGDSLTLGYGSGVDGEGSEGGYRLPLARMLDDAGVTFDFVGSQANGPTTLADRDHEGHNGFAVAQVAEVTDAAMDAHQPDVVLLLAGTNDQITFVPPSQSPALAAADLARLITQIDGRRRGVRIIVGQVIPLTHNEAGVAEYNALLPAIVTEARAAGIDIRLVDMHAIGTGNLSSDGIHPTAVGYERMAEIWFPALVEAIDDV